MTVAPAQALKGASGVSPIDVTAIDTIRTLAMDAVQAAVSGHPGTPMALAPVAYCLWQEFLRYDPRDPTWPNRDRFVLSCGHASMLLYAILHLAEVRAISEDNRVLDGSAVSLDEIKNFRQLGSKTPGHPEHELTGGVETTTGPLGQGLGNSVGMAATGKWLAARYSRTGFEDLFGFRVWTLCSDGDLMEGISNEAASLAGHLKLSNLCWIYDNNRITIEGHTDLAYSDDAGTRFEGYGWNVLRVSDANDLNELRRAFKIATETTDRPTLIIVDSHIGYGSPNKQDTHSAHGEALGEEEIRLTKRFYGWPEDAKFLVPDGVYERFRGGVGQRGKAAHAAWDARFAEYKKKHPDLADQLDRMRLRKLPDGWDKDIPTFPADAKGLATRESGGKVLNAIAKNLPWLIGGSADLAPSTKTLQTFEGASSFQATSYGGRNFHFGIRELGMSAVLNGMALTGVRPYGASFMVFTDYARPAIRLSAIMRVPVIYVFTHDSIGVGEDGPTHQPIEHLPALRAIPGLVVIRPGDANETAEAWRVAVAEFHRPTLLALTRQAVPTLDRTKYAPASGLARGGYVLADAPGGKPDLILIGTGSELSLCVDAYEALKGEGIKVRVVSLPCWELFDEQPREYRDSVLPPSVTARVSVEAASDFGWSKYVGPTGASVAMHSFGASGPVKKLMTHFGFTKEKVIEAARAQAKR